MTSGILPTVQNPSPNLRLFLRLSVYVLPDCLLMCLADRNA